MLHSLSSFLERRVMIMVKMMMIWRGVVEVAVFQLVVLHKRSHVQQRNTQGKLSSFIRYFPVLLLLTALLSIKQHVCFFDCLFHSHPKFIYYLSRWSYWWWWWWWWHVHGKPNIHVSRYNVHKQMVQWGKSSNVTYSCIFMSQLPHFYSYWVWIKRPK